MWVRPPVVGIRTRLGSRGRPDELDRLLEPSSRRSTDRHTFATFALHAGISTFDLSRYMGASLTMIDRHYGHLAHDGRERAIHLLDALNGHGAERWTLVDARRRRAIEPPPGPRQPKRRLSRQDTEAL